jgi:hypothetical protein
VSIEEYLQGKDPAGVALFRRFQQLVEACGTSEAAASRTIVYWKRQRVFVGRTSSAGAPGDEQAQSTGKRVSVSDRAARRTWGDARAVAIAAMARMFLLAMALLAVLTGTAAADLAPPRLSRAGGTPGQVVTGSGPSGVPVLMIRAQLAPKRSACRVHAVCEPYSVGAPSRRPWIRLGKMSGRVLPVTQGTIRFRIPHVAPGAYKIFIYCEPCYRGPRGSLITDDRLFRVRP